jgi:hypothetical protein
MEGDLEGAVALALESAAIAESLGWSWWEAGQYTSAAEIERELGRLDDGELHARRALQLGHGLGDRRLMVFAGSELAVIAAARDDGARAGLLWGAVESEVDAHAVGQWESVRDELEALIRRVNGPAFIAARSEGGLLSIVQAADQGAPAAA